MKKSAQASLDRVNVMIPFTSIIEQTAQVYREALGALGSARLGFSFAFEVKQRAPENAPRVADGLTAQFCALPFGLP